MLTGYQRKTVLLNMHMHLIVQRHKLDDIPYPDMQKYRMFDVWDMEAFIFQDETRSGLFRVRDMSRDEIENMQDVMFANHVLTLN